MKVEGNKKEERALCVCIGQGSSLEKSITVRAEE